MVLRHVAAAADRAQQLAGQSLALLRRKAFILGGGDEKALRLGTDKLRDFYDLFGTVGLLCT